MRRTPCLRLLAFAASALWTYVARAQDASTSEHLATQASGNTTNTTESWLGQDEASALVLLGGAAATALLGLGFLTPVLHRPWLLYGTVARLLRKRGFSLAAQPVHTVFVFLMLLPLPLIAAAAWRVSENHWRVAALGSPVAAAVYFASYGLARFRRDFFIWSRVAMLGLGASAACLMVFFVLFVCVVSPFSFIGTSISMLCLSAVPSTALAFAMLPWCSTTSVLAHLQRDGPLADGASQAFHPKRRIVVVSSCLLLSLCVLVGYGIVVMRLHPEESVQYVGFVVAAAVVVLDVMVWHLWRLGLVSGALETSTLMVAARVAGCIWGENLWLLGHSGVVLAAGVLLSHIAVHCWRPRPDSPEIQRQERAEKVLGLLESSLTRTTSEGTASKDAAGSDAPADDSGGAAAAAAAAVDPTQANGSAAGKKVKCVEHPCWLLLALVVAFSAEVGITWIPAVSPSLELWSVSVCDTCASRPQNYYGVLIILALGVYLLSLVVLRRAQWACCGTESPMLAVAWSTILPTYLVWLGWAAFVSYVADTWVVLVNAGFVPAMLYLFYEAYRNWVTDDYKLPPRKGRRPAAVAPDPGGGGAAEEGRAEPSSGDAAADPAGPAPAPAPPDPGGSPDPGGPAPTGCLCNAVSTLKSTPWTVQVWIADLILLFGYAAALQAVLSEERRWIAYTAAVAILVLALSFLSNRAWFGTLKFNAWQWGLWIAVGVLLAAWALLVWQIEREGRIDYFSLVLLLVVVLYPALYSTILAFQMLRDVSWAPKDNFTKKFILSALSVSGALYLSFLGMLAGLGFVAEAICGICLAGLLAVSGLAIWRWRRGGGFLPRHHRRLVALIFAVWVLLAAVALAFLQESLFGGFTVACVGAALLCAAAAWMEFSEIRSKPPLRQLRVPADCVFPTFRMGATGELKIAHIDILAALLLLLTVALWGMVAAAALEDIPYVGAVVAVLALTAAFLLLCYVASDGGGRRAALCELPQDSVLAHVRTSLEAEGLASASVQTEAQSTSAAAGMTPEEKDRQRHLLQTTLLGLADDYLARKEAFESAIKVTCQGRFHPVALISFCYLVNALVGKCKGGEGCMPDRTPGEAYEKHCDLSKLAMAVVEAVQRRQRFLARLQLCVQAAEAQRRWTKEADFRSFLASVGSTGGLTVEDFAHLPKRERKRIEEAYFRWREAEAEKERLDEIRRKEEEEAARRRREAERQAQEEARSRLAEAAQAGDVDGLRSTLRHALAVGLVDGDPAVVRARQALAAMQEATEGLQKALQDDDITALEEALLRAQVANLKSDLIDQATERVAQHRAAAEAERIRKAKARAEAQQELSRAIGAGSPERLEKALAAAETAGVEELQEARSTLKQLVDSQESLKKAIHSGKLENLQTAVDAARELGLHAAELDKAVELLEELLEKKRKEEQESEQREKEKKEAREALSLAIAEGSINALERALSKAEEAKLPAAERQEAKTLLARLKRIKTKLQEAVGKKDLKQLEQQLAAAKAAGLQDPLLGDVEALIAQLRVEAEARRKTEEDERKRREQELRRKQLEEEARRKREEEEARRRKKQQEDKENGTVPIQKIDPEEILRTIPQGGKFTDEDFEPSKALSKKYKWQRLPDFLDKPKMAHNGIVPDDVGQGELGDCWFLSAMACCAAMPNLLDGIFVHANVEKGLYICRIYKNGVWRDVAVDDQLPTKYGQPALAKSRTHKSEVWVSILEKAYAKIHGSYDAIEGGHVNDGCCDLTGGIGESMRLGDSAKQAINDGSLWAKLKQLHDDGHMIGCGSHSGSDSDISDKGIVQGHAYSILRVEEVDSNRLLQLRNPWGDTEWKGKWSDGDSKSWTQRMRAKLELKESNDGTFWMAFEDFVMHYSTVYICRVLGQTWQRQYASGSWRGRTAGGCRNYDTWDKNPVFRLKLEKKVRLLIVLEQSDTRGTDTKSISIGMAIFRAKANGERNHTSFTSSGSYQYERNICIETEIEPGPNGPHFIIATTFSAGQENDFSMMAFWHGDAGDVQLWNETDKT